MTYSQLIFQDSKKEIQERRKQAYIIYATTPKCITCFRPMLKCQHAQGFHYCEYCCTEKDDK